MALPDFSPHETVFVHDNTIYAFNGSQTVNVWRYASDGLWVNFDVFMFGLPPANLDEVADAIRRHHADALEVDGRYSGSHPRTALLYGLSHWVLG